MTSDANDLKLINHSVDGFLELKNLAADIHGDLAREVSAGHGSRHFRDVTHLTGQVAGHGVNGVSQIFPSACDSGHLRLPTELAVRTDLARHARYFSREHSQLLNHRVDDICRSQKFAFEGPSIYIESYGLGQVTLRDGGDRAGDFRSRSKQVLNEIVDGDLHLHPSASWRAESCSFSRSSFLTNRLAHPLQLLSHVLVGRNDVIEGVRNFPR